jgi:hypothetical protein
LSFAYWIIGKFILAPLDMGKVRILLSLVLLTIVCKESDAMMNRRGDNGSP